MKFKPEVQAQFKKAGWVEGRDKKEEYDSFPTFDKLPSFLKAFLYEYGNLNVETISITGAEPLAYLDLTVHKEWAEIEGLIVDGSEYNLGNLYTIGYYRMDNAECVCDDLGRFYKIGDISVKVSDNFKEGIEKMISENHSDRKEWHPDVKEWKVERY